MYLRTGNTLQYAKRITEMEPEAAATLQGSPEYPDIRGTVMFYRTLRGVMVVAEVFRLPYTSGACSSGIYGFHIHEGTSCAGNEQDPFANTGGHYNAGNCPHPQHAGDLPPLFGNNGYAWSAFITNRFTINEIMGRTVVIHGSPDDFTTQPAGNSGKKIACGVIR
jgi:Cu-Zn family superoxide dismutase